jgi:acyl-CoA synthetase (AMP-forming)/AMP-acid ligase II
MSASPSSSVPETCTPTTSTIAQLLPRAAQQHPFSGVHFPAADPSGPAEFLSYPALLNEALRILHGLQRRLEPALKVVLFLDKPRDFLPAFWACVLGGYIPCPLSPLRGDPQRWIKHVAHVD